MKIFRQGCQNWNMRVHRNRLVFFLKKKSKREHVLSELTNHGEKSLQTEGMIFLS